MDHSVWISRHCRCKEDNAHSITALITDSGATRAFSKSGRVGWQRHDWNEGWQREWEKWGEGRKLVEGGFGVGVRRGSRSGTQEVSRQEVQEEMHCCCHNFISCQGLMTFLGLNPHWWANPKWTADDDNLYHSRSLSNTFPPDNNTLIQHPRHSWKMFYCSMQLFVCCVFCFVFTLIVCINQGLATFNIKTAIIGIASAIKWPETVGNFATPFFPMILWRQWKGGFFFFFSEKSNVWRLMSPMWPQH